jgi:hypothetical protein
MTNKGVVVSSVDLIKWPGISEAAIPDLIHNLFGMGFVFAGRASLHRENGSSTDTFLMLLCEFPLSSPEELARPSAFAAERTGPNLDKVSSRNSVEQM